MSAFGNLTNEILLAHSNKPPLESYSGGILSMSACCVAHLASDSFPV